MFESLTENIVRVLTSSVIKLLLYVGLLVAMKRSKPNKSKTLPKILNFFKKPKHDEFQSGSRVDSEVIEIGLPQECTISRPLPGPSTSKCNSVPSNKSITPNEDVASFVTVETSSEVNEQQNVQSDKKVKKQAYAQKYLHTWETMPEFKGWLCKSKKILFIWE